MVLFTVLIGQTKKNQTNHVTVNPDSERTYNNNKKRVEEHYNIKRVDFL